MFVDNSNIHIGASKQGRLVDIKKFAALLQKVRSNRKYAYVNEK